MLHVRASRRGILALILVFILFSSCSKDEASIAIEAKGDAPVILISIDTLRSDHLPMYGYDGIETPGLDSLRRDSILFERAYSHYPMTFPSHVSMFTGQLPPEHGIRDNAGYRLEDGYRPWLPAMLKEAGYATGAAVSSFAIRGDIGIGQAFDVYDDEMESEEASEFWGPQRYGPSTLAAARRWLDGVAAEPFFLFFHLYEPHLPFHPPEAFAERWGETYDGEIAAADAVVGELLDDLRRRGLYDDSLIIFLSDHGEGLGDHVEEGHGVLLYRETLQVPLLVKLPAGQHAGSTVSDTVRLIDVLPTVAEVIGLEIPEATSGASLLELLGEKSEIREVFTETMYPRLHYGWNDLASLIRGRYQYIEGPDPELYDLQADPDQKQNILREERAVLADLRKRIKTYRAPLQLPSEENPETAEKLAALGYLSASPRASTEGPLPDPKEMMAHSRLKLDEAFGKVAEKDYEGAIPVLLELLDKNPMMTDAWENIGSCYRELGRHEEALEANLRAMELTRGSPQSTFNAGRSLVAMGRLDEARKHVDLISGREPEMARDLGLEIALAEGNLAEGFALVSGPEGVETSALNRRRLGLALSASGRHREALLILRALAAEDDAAPVQTALAMVLAETGQHEAAETILARVLETDPESPMAWETRGSPMAWETRGLVALRENRLADARSDLERAIEIKEDLPNSWNLLGVVRFQLGDAPGALDAWQRSSELDPGQLDALFNLALTAARMGRVEIARSAAERYLENASPQRQAREMQQMQGLLAQMGAGR